MKTVLQKIASTRECSSATTSFAGLVGGSGGFGGFGESMGSGGPDESVWIGGSSWSDVKLNFGYFWAFSGHFNGSKIISRLKYSPKVYVKKVYVDISISDDLV